MTILCGTVFIRSIFNGYHVHTVKSLWHKNEWQTAEHAESPPVEVMNGELAVGVSTLHGGGVLSSELLSIVVYIHLEVLRLADLVPLYHCKIVWQTKT